MTDVNWRKPLLVSALRLLQPVTYDELVLLRRLERAPAAETRALHDRRLEALLLHAFEQTDYYREVLGDCGVVRAGRADLSRFESIPFLTKDIIRSESDRLTAKALPKGRRPFENSSGGSTGQPARFLQDNVYWDVNVATKLFHFGWFGKGLGDRELKIWGSEYDLIKGRESLGSRAKSWLYNRRSEQCFSLPKERVEDIVSGINSFKPTSIWAYRDGIDVVAQHVNRHGLTMHRPAVVFCGGGTIYPHIFEAVGQAFRAPVASLYGSREMGDVACQCPEQDGLHVSFNSHKVEVIGPDGGPVLDREGELVVTSFHNYAMPFIRYRIGDRAAARSQPCPCGRGTPMVGLISGRVIERLVNARGDSVDASYLIRLFRELQGCIRRFQVVQEAPDLLTINVILEEGASRELVTTKLTPMSEKIRRLMGPDCRIDYRWVDDIPLTSSGKHPYVIRREQSHSTPDTAPLVA
jgi:phenylacetate-CoA ligase